MPFEIGQRVTFRSLQWEVEDTSSDGVLALFGRDRANQGHHIRVVLDLAEPLERTEIPELRWTVGDPNWDPLKWRALHHAYRLTLAHSRGNLASADWGRLILEPYQMVPLQRIENLPFPRILIADDTGLGKTAEAGLILFRLLQRRRADRILILCRARPDPERWRDEMHEKFGIDVEVINDGGDYARLRRDVPAHLNVFAAKPRIAMSMYFAAPSKRGSQIADDLARVRWDVVIVDEAHHLAEHGDGTKRLAELGEIVAQTCDDGALLLLTATPHDGKAASFASLLRLIDPYLVVDPDEIDPALVRPLLVRRLKQNVVKADGSRFLRRRIHPLEIDTTKAEHWLDKGLRGYCNQLRHRAKELRKAKQRSKATGAEFLESFLRRRLASSAHACRLSLVARLAKLEGRLEAAEDDDVVEDRDNRALALEEMELPSGKSELDVLRELVVRAERIPEGTESKIGALVQLVGKITASPHEKVVVFTEFVDTLELLARVFMGKGWGEADTDESSAAADGKPLFFRYEGQTPRNKREAIRRRFLEDPGVRMLLATDAASESINLHKGCRHLIHLETVWNPNRYEQRNGRIDRYGQTEQPQIYLLINKNSIDERVAEVGYRKLEKIADALGSVSNVLPLAARIDVGAFIARFGDEKIEEAAAAMEAGLDEADAAAKSVESTDGTADLIRGETFDDTDLRAVQAAIDESREFVPEFRDVQQFLEVFLRAEGGKITPTKGEPDVVSIEIPGVMRPELDGLERIDRATFLRDLAVREESLTGPKRVEFLSPGHPFVRAALRRARGWVFRSGFASRVSYVRAASGSVPGFVFTFAARFLDGRGEAIEERFEAVFVDLKGTASTNSAHDLKRFLDRGLGNLTSEETANLQGRFKPAFDRAVESATAEATRRAQERCKELVDAQRRVAEEALIRLGRWKQVSEQRLGRRATIEGTPTGGVQALMPGVADEDEVRRAREHQRRLKLFRAEQRKLLDREARRREDIRSLSEVRLESVEVIGGLAVVPTGVRA